jgi:methylenetetrahydrofolate reductase (NADPH)
MTIAPQGQKISDLLVAGPTLSFEFFPPKSDEAERQLEKAIHELAPLRPSFVSVTYGAGGSTRDRTRDIVIEVNRSQPFPAMPHLTCSGHTRAQITELLDEYAAAGIHNILALAGDPPADGSEPGGDFTYATELVEMVRDHPGDFAIGVAAHPELHPRSDGDREADRRWLAAKLALADFALTQFFY